MPDAESGGDNAFSPDSRTKIRSCHAGTCTCSAGIVGPDKTARKGERIEAGSVRIDSIGRPIRGSLPEEIDGREFVLVARPENNRNDRCTVYRGTVRRPMPFAEDDALSVSVCRLLPVTRFRWLRFIRAAGSRLTFASGRSKSDLARTDVEWRIKRFDGRRIAFFRIEYIRQYYVRIYNCNSELI